MTDTVPFGAWPSPISAADTTAASPRLEGARFVGDDIWWGETVAAEQGRVAVRRQARAGGPVTDVLPAPWGARSRVHEYGGGAWTVVGDGELVFVEASDQRVYHLGPGGEPTPLTPAGLGMRFGGLTWQGGRLLAVRETHSGPKVPPRDIVVVPLDGSAAITSLVAGSDFLAHPALSPDGTRLAWIAWNHPDMPWDRAELRVGRLGPDGAVVEWQAITGGPTSPQQPEWTGPDELTYADDPTGRWNLWRVRLAGTRPAAPATAIAPADADTGGPLWSLRRLAFAPLTQGRVAAVRTNGRDELVVLAPDGAATPVPLPVATAVTVCDAQGESLLITGTGAHEPMGFWLVELGTGAVTRVGGGGSPWSAWFAEPVEITVAGPHGPVHAFAYPPTNPGVVAPAGELPPYVVTVHGGPTGHVGPMASLLFAYLTSRGIGVLDVNYGGSSGYGRAYRERLLGQWGVVDVDDTIAAARGLAEQGLADPRRLAIMGGSAGGWTVLCALTSTDAFAAGIDQFGVADLRTLAADTHDFESRYLDGLVGPLPEAEAIYVERSPVSHLERFRTPMLIEQGLDDPIVPPSQSEAVRDALAAAGVPHAYLAFAGESHGFRRAETIITALEAELSFLGQTLGFDPPGVPRLSLS